MHVLGRSPVLPVLLCLSAGMAQADRLDLTQAPTQTSPTQFNGPYLSLQLSRSEGQSVIGERGAGAESGPGAFSATRLVLGAGYDFACGPLVCGIAASFMPDRIEAFPTGDDDFICDACTVTVRNLTELKARLGYPAGNALVFVTLGPARGTVAATADWNGIYTMGAGALSGYVAEIGVEYAAAEKTFVSVSMAHTDLGRLELPTDCFVDCWTDVSFSQIKVGLVRRW